jgi:hypothetical protein
MVKTWLPALLGFGIAAAAGVAMTRRVRRPTLLAAVQTDKVPVTKYGMVIRPRTEYPRWAYRADPGFEIPPELPVFTPQKFVSGQLVDTYRMKIDRGARPTVEVGKANGDVWMYDGHHRLAAYRMAGKSAPAWVHRRGHAAGGPTDAPRFSELDEIESRLAYEDYLDELVADVDDD